jgi:hypothetical protein
MARGDRKGRKDRKSTKKTPVVATPSDHGITRRRLLEGLFVLAAICQITGVTLRDVLPPLSGGTPVAITPGTGSITLSGAATITVNATATLAPASSHATATHR